MKSPYLKELLRDRKGARYDSWLNGIEATDDGSSSFGASVNSDRTAAGYEDFLANCEPNSSSARRSVSIVVRPNKALEHLFAQIGRYSGPFIANAEFDPSNNVLKIYPHTAAIRREAQCVV